MKLFYDILELGYARYLAGHINYLNRLGEKVAVCTNKSREVLYRNCAEKILPMPDAFYEKFGKLESDGKFMYDTDKNERVGHDVISTVFKNAYPEYEVVTEYSFYFGERILEPYQHSEEAELFCQQFKNCIVVFPRYRKSKFGIRNIPEENWLSLLNNLCQTYQDLDIITIGGSKGTLSIDLPCKNYFNLVPNENNLDILVALCNSNKIISTFGIETGIMFVALLCKATCFIIGAEKSLIEWENPNANFYFYESIPSDNGYMINNFDRVINEFVKFTNMNKFNKEGFKL